MGRHDDILYMAEIELPDGPHIMALLSHPSVIRQHLTNIVANQHKNAPDNDWKMKVTSIREVVGQWEIEEAGARLREANPERAMAGDVFPGEPNRILTERPELPDIQVLDPSVYYEYGLTPPSGSGRPIPPLLPDLPPGAKAARGSIGPRMAGQRRPVKTQQPAPSLAAAAPAPASTEKNANAKK